MIAYRYRAVSANGEIHTGEHMAMDAEALSQALAARGDTLLDCRRQRRRRQSFRATDRVLWLQEMAVLLQAGVPLHEALSHHALSSGAAAHVSRVLAESVASGQAFSASLAAWPKVFSPTAVAFVRAGEASGDLAAAMHTLADTETWWLSLKQRLRKALSYPLMTLGVLAVVVPVLLVVLVPQLTALLDIMGMPLPWYTQALITLSRFAVEWGLLLCGGLAALCVSGVALCAPGRPLDDWWAGRVLRLPMVGLLIRDAQFALLCRQVATLYKAGIPLDDGFRLAEQAATNARLKQACGNAAGRIQSGHSVSESLACSAVCPPVLLQLVRTGEHSGQLDTTLLQASEVFGRSADRRADHLIAATGPALLLIVAVVMGWLVGALLLPLYGSLFSLGGVL